MRLKANYLDLGGYRLPTEAEWGIRLERRPSPAAIMGRVRIFLGNYAWYTKNSQDRWMLPAGSLKPNDWGFFDMLGNAMEWTQGAPFYYVGGTRKVPRMDQGETEDIKDRQLRVLRGGSFIYHAMDVRSASRNRNQPSNQNIVVGFRPARTFTP